MSACRCPCVGNAPGEPGGDSPSEGEFSVIRFQDLVMTNMAAEKWAACAIDIRVVLNISFADAMLRPELTTEYAERYVKLPDIIIKLTGFRIGYATFILMFIDGTDEYIAIDFDYNDGDDACIRPHLAA
jgi:hypothetical protein